METVDQNWFAERAERWAQQAGPRQLAAAVATLPEDVALRSVVLVEGSSDRAAHEVLAARRGRDLSAEGVAVVTMGGAKNIWRFVRVFGPPGHGVRLAHGPHESVPVDDVVTTARTLALLALDVCGPARSG